MRNRTLVLIALFLVVIVAVSYVAFTFVSPQNPRGLHSKAIIRNFCNAEEEHAISVAENVNYADIFNITKLTGLAYVPQGNSSDYKYITLAQLIDAQVINYYETRYDDLNETKYTIKYTYTANVHTWDQIHVVYTPELDSRPENNNSISIVSSNGTILRQNGSVGTLFAYYNGSEYQLVNTTEIDFSLNKSYVVEMELQYREGDEPGSLSEFLTRVFQFVILDENYQPRLFSTYSANVVS